jgi:hypothetical protein
VSELGTVIFPKQREVRRDLQILLRSHDRVSPPGCCVYFSGACLTTPLQPPRNFLFLLPCACFVLLFRGGVAAVLELWTVT